MHWLEEGRPTWDDLSSRGELVPEAEARGVPGQLARVRTQLAATPSGTGTQT